MAEAATPEKGAEKPARTSREEAMASIGAKRAEELNTELDKDSQIEVTASTLDDEDDEDAKAERVAEAERKRLEREAAKAESGADAASRDTIYDFLDEPDLAKTKVRVKVDGKEEEVVLADALKDVQKLRAASRRLEEAAIVKKEAEDIRAAAQAEAAEIKRAAAEEAATGKKETPSKSAGFRDAVNLMYEGDQDKGADAFEKAVTEEISRRVNSGATVTDLTTKVRTQVAWDYALEQFAVDHKDIVGDPRSLKNWQEDLNAVAAESQTPAEAVRKATERFMGWRKSLLSGGDKVTTDDGALAARAAAKREQGSRAVRSSTSLASGGAPRESVALTPSQVIEEMKKLRGQLN